MLKFVVLISSLLYCGKAMLNGVFGADKEFPYMVALIDYHDRFICGACLHTLGLALTADHCSRRGTGKVHGVAGVTDYTLKNIRSYQTREVLSFLHHSNRSVDLALVVFKEEFEKTPWVNVLSGVNFTKINETFDKAVQDAKDSKTSHCYVMGWGPAAASVTRNNQTELATHIQKVFGIPQHYEETAQNKFEYKVSPVIALNDMHMKQIFGMAIVEKNATTCPGDEGGPCVCLLDASEVRLGILVKVGKCDTHVTKPQTAFFIRMEAIQEFLDQILTDLSGAEKTRKSVILRPFVIAALLLNIHRVFP